MGDIAPTTLLLQPKGEIVYETDQINKPELRTIGTLRFCSKCGRVLNGKLHTC